MLRLYWSKHMTTRSFSRCLMGALLLPALISCTKQGDIDTLYTRVNQNERQIATLSSQVGNVEQVLPGQAEMWAQMQAMRQELNALRGQVDEMNARAGGQDGQGDPNAVRAKVDRLEVALRQMASELGMKVEALDAAPEYGSIPASSAPTGTPSTSSTMNTTTPATTTAQPSAQAKDTATALYDNGMKAFSDRRYKDAVKIFTDFTQAYPSNKLSSNAHFWRGESFYQLKDYAAAALAYQQVIEKFPGSVKYQSAMLKQGMSFQNVGKKDAARYRLEELIKKYPNSPEAGRAKAFLAANK